MRYVELCAGIGGMSEGLNQAGHECVGYAECDTECKKCKTYTQHVPHPSKKFHTICCECGTVKRQQTHECYQILHDPQERMWSAYDVRSVSDDDIRSLGRDRGPIQMLVAGFPCQAFSIAGKREGFEDAIRGTVFFEIVRFASILRPHFILLENVTGLLNHDKGRTFETIIGALDELGYVGEWQVHNSASYVPQNRERVFIVASLRGSGRRKIFPFGRENSNSIKVVGRLEGNHDQNSRVYGVDGLAPTLSTMQGGGQEPKVLVKPVQFSVNGEGIAYCLDTGYPKGISENYLNKGKRTMIMEPIPVMSEIQCINPTQEDGKQTYQQDRVYNTNGVMTALTAQLAGRFNIVDGYRIRKLTPLECFRLQSYPDWWYYKLKEHGISDSQLYKMAGNGVTSAVARDIGERLNQI